MGVNPAQDSIVRGGRLALWSSAATTLLVKKPESGSDQVGADDRIVDECDGLVAALGKHLSERGCVRLQSGYARAGPIERGLMPGGIKRGCDGGLGRRGPGSDSIVAVELNPFTCKVINTGTGRARIAVGVKAIGAELVGQ